MPPRRVAAFLGAGALAALASSAARLPQRSGLPPGKMRGVCWEAAGAVEATSLEPLQTLGADWISQTPFGWCRSLTSPEVVLAEGGGVWGETDVGLAATARLARARGIRTLLKPHLWARGGEWVGNLHMSSEADWARWFASYEAFILHYARLAERERMEALAVGTELKGASGRAADWRRLITRVREVYRGPLTYCANWHEAEEVAFWDAVDFVGVQAYYPLSSAPRPPLEEIRGGWVPIVERLDGLHRRTGKPIVFTEVGWRSVSGALAEPWSHDTRRPRDAELQRDAFRAMFEAVWDRPWFRGTFVWKWHHAFLFQSPARAERDFTPQGKPALEVIRAYYARKDPSKGP